MTSSSLGSLLSIEESKTVLDEASSKNEHYLETGHLHRDKEFLSRAKCLKEAKTEDSEDLSRQKKDN